MCSLHTYIYINFDEDGVYIAFIYVYSYHFVLKVLSLSIKQFKKISHVWVGGRGKSSVTSYYKNTFLQVVTIICVALVADMWYVAMTPVKTAIVNGTFVGYIMLLTVIILGLVLETPLDRKLVSNGQLYVHKFMCACACVCVCVCAALTKTCTRMQTFTAMLLKSQVL